MTKLHTLAPSWLVLLIFLAGSSSATTLIPADFTAMVRESELIVHGTVIDVSARTRGSLQTIESLVTVRVAETLKGTPSEEAVFRVPGGAVGRYRRVMVGAPEFTTGDEVIVFLTGRAPAMPMPYGLSQGVYRVTRQGGAAAVTPLVATTAGRVVRGDPSRRPLDPLAFAARVRMVSGVGDVEARRAVPRVK